MASYQETVLALSPVAFWRLNEVAGPTIIDISGNGHNGTYDAAAQFGFFSPIETDAGSFAIRGPAGQVPAPALSDLDLLDNFTWLGWAYYDDAAMLTSTSHLLSRRGQFGLSNNIQIGINGGQITADLTLDTGGSGTFYRLVANATLVDQTWYFLAAVRNGAVWRLYVNADLGQGNERVDLTLDQVDYDVPGTPWSLGRATSTTVFPGVGSDEIALFDYALTEAQVIQVYESALLSTFISGVSSPVPSAVLYSDFPDPPVEFPFRHNWESPLIERISFRTNLTRTRSGSEEAGQVRPKPRREIEISQMLRDNTERRELRAKLWANQNKKWFIPILEYRQQLTSPLLSGSTSIPVSTLYTEYEVDSWIQLRQLNSTGRVVKSENQQITADNGDSVEVAAVENDYDAMVTYACPAKRGYLPNSISVRGHTDTVEDLSLIFQLLPEDEPGLPNRIIPYIPTIKYRDYEVFDGSEWQSNDWSEQREYEIDREQEDVDFDSGIFTPESDTPGASESFSYRMTLQGRENNAAFLGWFYERAGSLNYVWVPTMQSDFEVASVLGADLTVEGTNYSDNFALAEARRDLAFVYNDFSMDFRRVIGFSGTTNETLELDANVPSLTNLKFVSLLKFCRLDADTLEIAKHTDDVWKYAFRFRELLESPAGTGLSSLSPSASASRSGSPSGSVSPSASTSPTISASESPSPSLSLSPSASQSPSSSVSRSPSPSSSVSPSASSSPSGSTSPSV